MAGDWIKMRGNLWDDPRVGRLADTCDTSEASIVGGLYWLWATADQHTQDGILPGLSLRRIDSKTGIPGFGSALVAIGWITEEGDGIRIQRFEEHNGASAKKRAVTGKRVANFRSGNADVTPTELPKDDANVTGALAREEKRREEEIPLAPNGACPPDGEPAPKSGYAVPDCPHQTIVDLYHQRLPSLPRVEVWNDTRKGMLRSRWREVCAEQKLSVPQGLDWFKDYFALVKQSDFLNGRAPPKPGGRPFSADLEWLVRPQNFVKVIEGKYRNELR